MVRCFTRGCTYRYFSPELLFTYSQNATLMWLVMGGGHLPEKGIKCWVIACSSRLNPCTNASKNLNKNKHYPRTHLVNQRDFNMSSLRFPSC